MLPNLFLYFDAAYLGKSGRKRFRVFDSWLFYDTFPTAEFIWPRRMIRDKVQRAEVESHGVF